LLTASRSPRGRPPPSPAPPDPKDSSIDRVKEVVRDYEQAFCGSVYFLSSAARCSQLAVDLQTRFYSSRFTPPSPAPAPPETPLSPPVPLPPLPTLSDGIVVHDTARVYLSTVLSPIENPQLAAPSVSRVLYGWNTERATAAYRAYADSTGDELGRRVGCTSMQQRDGAPLPCATALDTSRCIDGFRPCGDASDEGIRSNGEGVELVMDLEQPSRSRRKYPVSLRIQLPPEDERATLLYESRFGDGGSGYEVLLFRSDGSPVSTFVRQQNSQTHGYRHAKGLFLVHHDLVSATASDRDLYELSSTRYVHIRLKGSYRQLSLQRVDLLERDLYAEGILEPPPPPPPPPLETNVTSAPPSFPPPPHGSFKFYKEAALKAGLTAAVVVDACGLDDAQCAQSAYDLRVFHGDISAFSLSVTGCCRLLVTNTAAIDEDTDLETSPVAGHAGVGLLTSVR
jgi:hypothetical protein